VSGVDQRGAGGAELGNEGVAFAAVRGPGSSCRGRKVVRKGLAGDVGVARGIHRDADSLIGAAAAQVGRVDNRTAGTVLGDEGVSVAAISRAVGPGRSLEGAPRRESRHVSVAGGIRRNAVSLVEVGASQISRVA